jgi:hypothetical protein
VWENISGDVWEGKSPVGEILCGKSRGLVVVVVVVVVGMCVAGVIRRGIWCMVLESSGRVGFCVWEILWEKFLQGKISGSKICGRRLWGWSEWFRVQTWG